MRSLIPIYLLVLRNDDIDVYADNDLIIIIIFVAGRARYNVRIRYVVKLFIYYYFIYNIIVITKKCTKKEKNDRNEIVGHVKQKKKNQSNKQYD